jgi:hypothetical protein
MAGRRAKAKVDPELRRQLDVAAQAAPVQAVMRLRPATRSAAAPPPQGTREQVALLVTRVAGEMGVAAAEVDFNVFPNLGFFVLSAAPDFVERMLVQPEVASASANRRKA